MTKKKNINLKILDIISFDLLKKIDFLSSLDLNYF